jgi:hypothetical protein
MRRRQGSIAVDLTHPGGREIEGQVVGLLADGVVRQSAAR